MTINKCIKSFAIINDHKFSSPTRPNPNLMISKQFLSIQRFSKNPPDLNESLFSNQILPAGSFLGLPQPPDHHQMQGKN